jgi:hypothetical protein
MIPLTYVESAINEAMHETYGELPHHVRKMSPGIKHANRIAEIKMDIRELDPMAEDFMTRVAAMREEIKRLEVQASKDAGPKWIPDLKADGSIRTIGEVWDSMDNGARAKWLCDNGWKITVAKIEVSKAEAEELRAEGLLPFTIGIDAGFAAEVSAEAQLLALGHDVLSSSEAKKPGQV